MPDDSMLAVLQEIRDLQKQHLEQSRLALANQERSLANQERSLAVQQEAVNRQKKLAGYSTWLRVFVLLSVFVLVFLAFATPLLRAFMELLRR
jgi:hypothetical protein